MACYGVLLSSMFFLMRREDCSANPEFPGILVAPVIPFYPETFIENILRIFVVVFSAPDYLPGNLEGQTVVLRIIFGSGIQLSMETGIFDGTSY